MKCNTTTCENRMLEKWERKKKKKYKKKTKVMKGKKKPQKKKWIYEGDLFTHTIPTTDVKLESSLLTMIDITDINQFPMSVTMTL